MNEPPTSEPPTLGTLQPFFWLNSHAQPPLMFLFFHLVIMTQMSAVGVDTNSPSCALSLSLCRFFFFFLSFMQVSVSQNHFRRLFLGLFITNHLMALDPWPRWHADLPDVPSLIMNNSRLISQTTIAGKQPRSWYTILAFIFRWFHRAMPNTKAFMWSLRLCTPASLPRQQVCWIFKRTWIQQHHAKSEKGKVKWKFRNTGKVFVRLI